MGVSKNSKYKLNYPASFFDKYYNIVVPQKPVRPTIPKTQSNYNGLPTNAQDIQRQQQQYVAKLSAYNNSTNTERTKANNYIQEIYKQITKINKATSDLKFLITAYKKSLSNLTNAGKSTASAKIEISNAISELGVGYVNENPNTKINKIKSDLNPQKEKITSLGTQINQISSEINARVKVLNSAITVNNGYLQKFNNALNWLRIKQRQLG